MLFVVCCLTVLTNLEHVTARQAVCTRVLRRLAGRVQGAAFRQWRWYVQAEQAAALGSWSTE